MKPVVEKPAEDEGEDEESDRIPRFDAGRRFIRGALGNGGAFIYKGVAILRWSRLSLLFLFPLTQLLLLLLLPLLLFQLLRKVVA